MKLAELIGEIEKADNAALEELPVKLTEIEKTHYENQWRSYRERDQKLKLQRGQAYSMIRGQCTQRLLDEMKSDPDWTAVSTSFDPLELLALIEKTILAQTEDQYPYAAVYQQETTLFNFVQNNLTNAQWYEKFNTKVDVGSAIGVTRVHQVLTDLVTKEDYGETQKFETLTADQQADVLEDAQERYLSYIFLRQSGKQHNKLKVDLQNDYTKNQDKYPKTRQEVLHMLDKYSNSTVPKEQVSEGTAFTQQEKQKRANEAAKKKKAADNKKFWADKECYNCGQKGHPANQCTNKKAKKDEEDKDSKSSKSNKTTKEAIQKKFNKSFATMKKLQTQIEELEDDSDASDSDESGTSHLQFSTTSEGFHFTQTGTVLNTFEQRNEDVLFKQNAQPIDLDLKKVILLDNQSTMDLFCNADYGKWYYQKQRQDAVEEQWWQDDGAP